MAQTQAILEEYFCKDVAELIIKTAFSVKSEKEIFLTGFYEECQRVLKEIKLIDLSDSLVSILCDTLIGYVCEGGHMNIYNLVVNAIGKNMYIGTGAYMEHVKETIKI